MVAEPAQLWPQLDIRDPLGVWGARALVTGDASGGSIKEKCQAPAERTAAFFFTPPAASDKVRFVPPWGKDPPVLALRTRREQHKPAVLGEPPRGGKAQRAADRAAGLR